MKAISRILITGLLALLLAGCTLGLDYQRPAADVPVQYKNDAPWKVAAPADQLPKGNWWEVYQDPQLNALQQQAATANQSLQVAYARLSQVQAAVGFSAAERLPRLDLNAAASRKRTAADLTSSGQSPIGNSFTLPLMLSYEIDLWGRVKRSVEAAQADADAAVADYQALLLTLQAELARNYFSLRALDNEISLLRQTIELRNEFYQLVQSMYEHGQVSQLDLSRAESELATTRAELIGLQRQRGELENSIAVLLGQPPANFSLAAAQQTVAVPQLAAGLPSSLLERRPDVAAAERQMAAASARIGVAKTAFFPAISLTGSAGFGSDQVDSLFSWDNRTWGLGPAISLPIFAAGRNSANLERAKAAYEEAIANYRQQLLVAFAEVENGLSGLRLLDQQGQVLQQAVAAALRAGELSVQRYRAGLVSYLEVLDSQRTALQAARSLNQLQGEQLRASVLLIKALGGGWAGV
ncbi:MAG TPA: efflux transporter outer membrane subunit [Malonomonas sp.]